jgi:hypothetical protein
MQIRAYVTPESSNAVRLRFEGLKSAIPKQLSLGIKAATIFTLSLIKREVLSGQFVRRVSGNLSRSGMARMESDTVGVVEFGREAPYARFVSDGTRAHEIHGNPLAFVAAAGAIMQSAFVSARSRRSIMKQNTVFARVVHHPGTAPTHFAEIGLAMATPEIRRIVQERVNRGIKGDSNE